MADHLNVKSYPRLLRAFSSDEDAAATAFFKLRNSLVRFFQLKGDDDPDRAADETLDRVSAKLGDGVAIVDITKYSFGVARLVFLEDLRKAQRKGKALQEYSLEEKRSTSDDAEDGFDRMRECFSKLTQGDQELLRSYYADLPRHQLDERRRQLASVTGGSVNSLRLKIFRLRRRLEECVRGTPPTDTG